MDTQESYSNDDIFFCDGCKFVQEEGPDKLRCRLNRRLVKFYTRACTATEQKPEPESDEPEWDPDLNAYVLS